jgi:hypothetical protein
MASNLPPGVTNAMIEAQFGGSDWLEEFERELTPDQINLLDEWLHPGFVQEEPEANELLDKIVEWAHQRGYEEGMYDEKLAQTLSLGKGGK